VGYLPFRHLTRFVLISLVALLAPRQPRVLPILNSTAPILPVSPPVVSEVPRTLKKELICGNCKSRGLRCVGHIDATCFQPGGGMEGHREEYLSNKGRIHAMFVDCLENTFLLPELSLPPDFSSPPPSPIPSSLDDESLLHPIANLSVSSYVPNSHFHECLYTSSEPQLPPFAMPSINFSSTTFISLNTLYNALLDSGCTHHIIRDRSLFRNYSAQAISVGTANCGSLEALGTGDVDFTYSSGDRHVTFTLRSCLFAPMAPINLLSVGALAE
jgi:hypothetical protein